MIVAINGNRHQDGHFDDISHLVDFYLRRDDRVVMTDRFLDYLEDRIGGHFAHASRLRRGPTWPLPSAATALSSRLPPGWATPALP